MRKPNKNFVTPIGDETNEKAKQKNYSYLNNYVIM